MFCFFRLCGVLGVYFFFSLLVPVVYIELLDLVVTWFFVFLYFFVQVGEINGSKIGWTGSENPLLSVKHDCMNITWEGSVYTFSFQSFAQLSFYWQLLVCLLSGYFRWLLGMRLQTFGGLSFLWENDAYLSGRVLQESYNLSFRELLIKLSLIHFYLLSSLHSGPQGSVQVCWSDLT